MHCVAKLAFDWVSVLENGTINHDNDVKLGLLALVDICGSKQILFKFDKSWEIPSLFFTHKFATYSHFSTPSLSATVTVANNRDSWQVNKTEMKEKKTYL